MVIMITYKLWFITTKQGSAGSGVYTWNIMLIYLHHLNWFSW